MRSFRAIAALALLAAPAPLWAQAGKAAGPRADREFMIGRWTDTGDCADSVLLESSGQFTSSTGGEGRWTMAGDTLTFSGERELRVRVVPIDHDTVDVVNEDGSLGRSTRCDDSEDYDPNAVIEVI